MVRCWNKLFARHSSPSLVCCPFGASGVYRVKGIFPFDLTDSFLGESGLEQVFDIPLWWDMFTLLHLRDVWCSDYSETSRTSRTFGHREIWLITNVGSRVFFGSSPGSYWTMWQTFGWTRVEEEVGRIMSSSLLEKWMVSGRKERDEVRKEGWLSKRGVVVRVQRRKMSFKTSFCFK